MYRISRTREADKRWLHVDVLDFLDNGVYFLLLDIGPIFSQLYIDKEHKCGSDPRKVL